MTTEFKMVPENCRQRLAHDGKACPRSSCAVCGQFSPKWKECDSMLAAAPASPQAAQPVAWPYRPECGSEKIRHQEGEHKQCAVCHQEWFAGVDYSDFVRKHLSGKYADKDQVIEILRAKLAKAEVALKFYAEREHYHFESGNWDTVSGEPLNILWNGDEPDFIEDGTVARNALFDSAEPTAPNCKYCGDTGQFMVGTSGDASDGNAPIMACCEDCELGEPSIPIELKALRAFVGAAYPVASEIKKRGYNWCESYLDEALVLAQAALSTAAKPEADHE